MAFLDSYEVALMKKFRIVYSENYNSQTSCTIVCAETEDDAKAYFFKKKSGLLLRCEPLGYL